MSSHALLRVGEDVDLFYTDPKNCEKQAIPVEYNTRFTQAFSNLGQGVSVFTIPPGNGLRHILIVVGYSAAALAAAAAQTGLYGLPRGWGYQAIKQISFRIGGSSQYFLTGDQLLARNMRLCRTKEQRNAMLQLGGSQAVSSTDLAQDQFAYIPVSVFAAPNADGISLPLSADLLSQQVQITAEIAPTSDFWVLNAGSGLTGAPPAAFSTGYFQVEQLVMEDRGMSLANRVDLNTHSYNMPLPDFDQQEVVIPLANSGAGVVASQSVVLSGFRAGEVKKMQIWLTKNTDTLNQGRWYKPAAVQVLYAGVIYSQYDNGSSAMWNLLDGTAPSAVDYSALALPPAPGQVLQSTGVLSEWVELPFAQPTGNDYDGEVLVHGKQITNGIVNLSITPPASATGAATDIYTLHVAYIYNCTASFSKGSCDLVF
jgi:hypothetical protein